MTCEEGAVVVREPRLKVDLTRFIDEHTFLFDDAYEEDVSNYELYKSCVYPLVSAFVADNAKCTCFAYGQTGSGKTYAYISRVVYSCIIGLLCWVILRPIRPFLGCFS